MHGCESQKAYRYSATKYRTGRAKRINTKLRLIGFSQPRRPRNPGAIIYESTLICLWFNLVWAGFPLFIAKNILHDLQFSGSLPPWIYTRSCYGLDSLVLQKREVFLCFFFFTIVELLLWAKHVLSMISLNCHLNSSRIGTVLIPILQLRKLPRIK